MLRVSRQVAEELFASRIEEGQALNGRVGLIGDVSDYESWKAGRKDWLELTAGTLIRTYHGAEQVAEFNRASSPPTSAKGWQAECEGDAESVRTGIDVLISLQARLELALEPSESELALEPSVDSEFALEPSVDSELGLELDEDSSLAPVPTIEEMLAQLSS